MFKKYIREDIPDEKKNHKDLNIGSFVLVQPLEYPKWHEYSGEICWSGRSDSFNKRQYLYGILLEKSISFMPCIFDAKMVKQCRNLFATEENEDRAILTPIYNVKPYELKERFEHTEIPKLEQANGDFSINSAVEVQIRTMPFNQNPTTHYGQIMWQGYDSTLEQYFYGIALLEKIDNYGTDGTFYGWHLFQAEPGCAVLAEPKHVFVDSRICNSAFASISTSGCSASGSNNCQVACAAGKPAVEGGRSGDAGHAICYERCEIPTYYRKSSLIKLNSAVEVCLDDDDQLRFGSVKWMGRDTRTNDYMIGIELLEEFKQLSGSRNTNKNRPSPASSYFRRATSGQFEGQRLFQCEHQHGILVPARCVSLDSRFYHAELADPAKLPISPIPHAVDSAFLLDGRNRGIQGAHNSCYIDVVLMAFFAFSKTFDSIFCPTEISEYDSIKHVLSTQIVTKLRSEFYVSHNHVQRFRKEIENYAKVLPNLQGITNEIKDAEEFLEIFFSIFMIDPEIKLRNHNAEIKTMNVYRISFDTEFLQHVMTVQELLQFSLSLERLTFCKMPNYLILKMPRGFLKPQMKLQYIIPNFHLSLRNFKENANHSCSSCSEAAKILCLNCSIGKDFTECCFCELHWSLSCGSRRHSHTFLPGDPHNKCSRDEEAKFEEVFILRAAICIKTSHYVAYLRSNDENGKGWIFYDSMADRNDDGSFNIPEGKLCSNITEHLCDCNRTKKMIMNENELKESGLKRLFSDVDLCFYEKL